MKLIIADSGPLIMLARSGLLDVLRQIAGSIVVPATVFEECTRDNRRPGAAAIVAALASGQLAVHAGTDPRPLGDVPTLDAGEISALALALELKQPVLMDERLGRQVAALHRIAVVGSAGILLAAKQKGLVPAITPILRQWQEWGYFLSPTLLAIVLERADE